MAYGDFKDLSRSLLYDKAVNVAKNLKYNGYQRGIASMVFKFLDKNLLWIIFRVMLPKLKLCQTNN